MKNNDLIIGIGEVLWDMLPAGKQLGGAPANFAYHMSHFGMNSCIVSAVGCDEAGLEMIDCIREKEISFHLQKVSYPTGSVEISLSDEGIPCYDIKENVAWDNIPFTSEIEELAHRTHAICFGSLAQRSCISRSTINRFLETMRDGEGIYKIFDINLRQSYYEKDVLQDSLLKCNILKINDEELKIVSQLFHISFKSVEDCCRALLTTFHLRMIILTCGAEGSYVFTPEESSFEATRKIQVVDTVGAGDSFTAAFCAALLNGKAMKVAHRFATEFSAFVCTEHGAMPILPRSFMEQLVD